MKEIKEQSFDKGILVEKLKVYYEDVNLLNYRNLLCEAIQFYRGVNFSKVLDIGSGIGLLFDSISPFNFEMYALEASEYGLMRLKEKNYKSNAFYLNYGNNLPFQDNHFSLVVLNQVIEHLSKNVGQYYIGEIIRVLEPGGVAIIKSPSAYSRIWRTDPHHVYCWKPLELMHEISKYESKIRNLKLQRLTLEPWMFCSYDERIIDTWHKENKYKNIRFMFNVATRLIDRLLFQPFNSDLMLAVSNVTFVKSGPEYFYD